MTLVYQNQSDFGATPNDLTLEPVETKGRIGLLDLHNEIIDDDDTQRRDSLLLNPDWESMDVGKFGQSFYDMDEEPLSEPIRLLKLKTINKALARNDYDTLLKYMRSAEGLVSNEQRSKVWSTLFGIGDDRFPISLIDNSNDTKNDELHKSSFNSLNGETMIASSNTEFTTSVGSKSEDSLENSTTYLESPIDNEKCDDLSLELKELGLTIEDLSGPHTEESSPSPKIDPESVRNVSSFLKLSAEQRSEGLLSTHHNLTKILLEELDTANLPPHRDEEQVKLDINRSSTILSHLQMPSTVNESFTEIFSPTDIDEVKKKLQILIVKVLRKYPSLCYYQGYHDIASIVLIVCYNSGSGSKSESENLAFRILEKLTLFHLRDFMVSRISLSTNHLLIIPCILENADAEFFKLIKAGCKIEGFEYDYKFYQAISSILTMFSHDITNVNDILLIWDFVLSYNSVLVNVYIYVAALLYYKTNIFAAMGIEDEIEVADTSNGSYNAIDGTAMVSKSKPKSKSSKKAKSSKKENPKKRIPKGDANIDFHIDRDLLHTLVSPTNLFQNLNKGDLIKILNLASKLIGQYPVEDLSNGENTFQLWFSKYNKHSVLKTTSTISNSYQEIILKASKYKFLYNKDDLQRWIRIQDSEMDDQDNYYTELMLQQASQIQLDDEFQRFSSSSASEKSGSLLLASSISSLSSSTAALNSKILTTSQVISRLFFADEVVSANADESSDENEVHLDKNKKGPSKRVLNIFRISITIGFVGFLIHFIINRQNYRWQDLQLLKNFNYLSDQIISLLWKAAYRVGEFVNNSLSEHKINGFVGQVGLGNIRNNIYRMN